LIKKKISKNIWPIDIVSNKRPADWKNWPDNKKFALVITHDVETGKGFERVKDLLQIDKSFDFYSCFNFVPKRYNVKKEILDFVRDEGFEIGVHGLYHDGKLFSSEKIFNERFPQINNYLQEWKSCGFYAPSTLRNLDWIHKLNIEYDSSTFDTDPFEPQPNGAKTIYPFFIKNEKYKMSEYLEIPYTVPQDFTLYIILKEKNINIMKEKIDWIIENGGMVNFRTHPDYMNFEDKNKLDEYPVKLYTDLLEYIKTKYEGFYWNVLPKDLCKFWKENYKN
jgi:hypothetical protein